MYLHLGHDTTVLTQEIIGLFDLDTTTVSGGSRDFLSRAQREERVVNTFDDLPRSFVLAGGSNASVYICQPSTQTLKKRILSLE